MKVKYYWALLLLNLGCIEDPNIPRDFDNSEIYGGGIFVGGTEIITGGELAPNPMDNPAGSVSPIAGTQAGTGIALAGTQAGTEMIPNAGTQAGTGIVGGTQAGTQAGTQTGGTEIMSPAGMASGIPAGIEAGIEPLNDIDMDGIEDRNDNCIDIPNPNQEDFDSDGRGDACDESTPTLTIDLAWEDPNLDFDLHVLNYEGQYFEDGDCWSRNRSPSWAQPGLLNDAPGEGGTSERTELINSASTWYTIGVDLYTGRSSSQGTAQVRVICRDQIIDLGSQMMNSQNGSNRSFWEVARIHSETCQVQAIQEVNDLSCPFSNTTCTCQNCLGSLCPSEGCSDGRSCDLQTGACIDPCLGVNCELGQICNYLTGQCQNTQCAPCMLDEQCGSNAFCVGYNLNTNQGFKACGTVCENDANCAPGHSCESVIRSGVAVNICADLSNLCEPSICELITCPDDLICDPTNGACIECIRSNDCAEGSSCLNGSCLAPDPNRNYTPWSSASAPFCLNDSNCTTEENCEPYSFLGTFCLMACGDGLGCPEQFTCCNTSIGQRCIYDQLTIFDTVCQ